MKNRIFKISALITAIIMGIKMICRLGPIGLLGLLIYSITQKKEKNKFE
jgi:hypothetical protein